MEEQGEFLINVLNDNEADIVEALLNAEGIPLLRKYKGTGAYLKVYMGSSNFGVDLYVPKKELEKAKEIIENNTEVLPKKLNEDDIEGDLEENNLEAENIEEDEDSIESNIGTRLLLFIVLFLLFSLVVIIVNFIKNQ